MKKKIIIPLVLATLVGTAVIGVSANTDNAVYSKKQTNTSNVSSEITTNDATNSSMNDSTSTQGISKEEAKAIAFKHAKVTENDITNLKITKDTEDGILVYEVDFNLGLKEFDYEINAENGNIISFDVDHNEDKNSNTTTSNGTTESLANDSTNNTTNNSTNQGMNHNSSSSNHTAATQFISKEDAKAIALNHAGVKEADIKNFTIKLDQDDKTPEYEIEFYVSNKEYDYSIHAKTGAILESSIEVEDSKDNNQSGSTQNSPSTEVAPSNIISKEEAKKIALAKVTGATDSHIRIHLEKEDGKYVYEGTIQYNNKEYDFEIDATTGTVLDWDVEAVDADELN